MKYGHRNDVEGYAKARSYFDEQLPRMIEKLNENDLLLITADHGCDPSTPSTDHSREYVPIVAVGPSVKSNVNLGTLESFADTGATVLDWFGIFGGIAGSSYRNRIVKE